MSRASVGVELVSIGKRFGGIRALNEVSLNIRAGTVHGLVGENGAGKSTLGKVVAGVIGHDEGQLVVAGRPVRYRSPREALGDGIAMIAQEMTLVPRMSVLRNVFLGVEGRRLLVRDDLEHATFASLSASLGFEVPSSVKVSSLRVADQQKVGILRALARDARVLVMDEPTAALPRDEIGSLFETIKLLRHSGVTVIYISHALQEVLDLVDDVTILRDGRVIRTAPARSETAPSLVTAMLGRSLSLAFPEKTFPPLDARVVLRVDHLSSPPIVRDVSLEVRSGEIVGLAGLVGSGRSEVARAIFGADRAQAAIATIDDKQLKMNSTRQAVRAGVALLPEDRKLLGLLMRRPVLENVTLPHLTAVSRFGVLNFRRERKEALAQIEALDVRPPNLRAVTTRLSGGNQQKVLFAKWLFRRPHVLIADEPTRGVDVGAKRAIYDLIVSLAREGMAILLISSELEEVLGLSHRVLVMRNGSIVRSIDGRTITEEMVLAAAFEVSATGTVGA